MVISLASGLAVSSRSASTVHQTANLSDSEQALATAESAAEKIMQQNIGSASNLFAIVTGAGFTKSDKTLTTACTALPCFKDMGNNVVASVNLTATPVVGVGEPFNFYLEKEDTQQVWINDNSNALPVNLCWQLSGELPAALEVTIISGVSPNYVMAKYAYDPQATTRGNGFSIPADPPNTPYQNCVKNADLTLPQHTQAIRLHAYYAGTSVQVIPRAMSPTGTIPFQGHVITATGYAGSVKRTLEVTKTLPQLPAIFDYGIYSGGGLN